MGKAANKRRRYPNLKVIGITGSYGKTTTKDLLAYILTKNFRTLKTPNHQNSEFGVSRAILKGLNDEHQMFVCEMGAYSKGEIRDLARIAQPQIAIIAGVNKQHLATFGSFKNLLSAEGGVELVKELPEEGVVIANWDSVPLREQENELKALGRRIIWVSRREQKDVWADSIQVEKEKISFDVIIGQEKAKIEVNILGIHNIENLLLGIAAAHELGMSLKDISEALWSVTSDFGAMQIKRGSGGLNIIDSMYSANPDGVIADVEYLNTWQGRKAIVMPCLIELGIASKEAHYEIGKKIGEVCDRAIIITKECYNDIKRGAVSSGMPEGQIVFIEDPKEILSMLKNMTGKEDVILLESRLPSKLVSLFDFHE